MRRCTSPRMRSEGRLDRWSTLRVSAAGDVYDAGSEQRWLTSRPLTTGVVVTPRSAVGRRTTSCSTGSRLWPCRKRRLEPVPFLDEKPREANRRRDGRPSARPPLVGIDQARRSNVKRMTSGRAYRNQVYLNSDYSAAVLRNVRRTSDTPALAPDLCYGHHPVGDPSCCSNPERLRAPTNLRSCSNGG